MIRDAMYALAIFAGYLTCEILAGLLASLF